MRAIAVIWVVLYHSKIKIFNYEIFKGGFLGVDIFFVISGYIITKIALSEYNLNQTISISSFFSEDLKEYFLHYFSDFSKYYFIILYYDTNSLGGL